MIDQASSEISGRLLKKNLFREVSEYYQALFSCSYRSRCHVQNQHTFSNKDHRSLSLSIFTADFFQLTAEVSTLFDSTGIDLDEMKSAFKFQISPIGVSHLKILLNINFSYLRSHCSAKSLKYRFIFTFFLIHMLMHLSSIYIMTKYKTGNTTFQLLVVLYNLKNSLTYQ